MQLLFSYGYIISLHWNCLSQKTVATSMSTEWTLAVNVLVLLVCEVKQMFITMMWLFGHAKEISVTIKVNEKGVYLNK